MNHFLHLLILLAALFTTIIALPTTPFDDTSDSWTDPTLDNTDTLLAGTFDGPISQDAPASNNPEKLPPVKTQPQDQSWSKPLFICCTNARAWVDEPDEKQCRISIEYIQLSARRKSLLTTMCTATRDENDTSCTWQGEARYCPKGIRVSFLFFNFLIFDKKRMIKKLKGGGKKRPENETISAGSDIRLT